MALPVIRKQLSTLSDFGLETILLGSTFPAVIVSCQVIIVASHDRDSTRRQTSPPSLSYLSLVS